jgi:hypothetical protein
MDCLSNLLLVFVIADSVSPTAQLDYSSARVGISKFVRISPLSSYIVLRYTRPSQRTPDDNEPYASHVTESVS